MAESISLIKEKYNNIKASEGGMSAFIAYYKEDTRSGVKSLVQRAQKQLLAIEKEKERVAALWEFENKYRHEYKIICGIDEAGRGPLAGPVVAGAVILPEDADILYINDSKKLSAAKRSQLYDEIMDKAKAVGTGMANHEEIDQYNILNATYLAMRRAIEKLSIKPDILLNDAVVIPEVGIKQVGIIKGDAKSVSIASASIIAKVTRDRMMEEFDIKYPGYGFAKHKGYGTKDHYEAIKKQGLCPIHRRSFLSDGGGWNADL